MTKRDRIFRSGLAVGIFGLFLILFLPMLQPAGMFATLVGIFLSTAASLCR